MSQEILGGLVVLWLSETGANFKTVVCEEQSQASTTNNVSTTNTKCGVFKAPGNPESTITGSGVVDAKPAANQVSYKQLQAWAQNKTLLYFVYQNAADAATSVAKGEAVYMDGRGYITECTITATEGDVIKFNWALSITGTVDNTADS